MEKVIEFIYDKPAMVLVGFLCLLGLVLLLIMARSLDKRLRNQKKD